jgi:hypothetical protein
VKLPVAGLFVRFSARTTNVTTRLDSKALPWEGWLDRRS